MTNKKLMLCMLAMLIGTEVRGVVLELGALGVLLGKGVAISGAAQKVYEFCTQVWTWVPSEFKAQTVTTINKQVSNAASGIITYGMQFASGDKTEYEIELEFSDLTDPETIKGVTTTIASTLLAGKAKQTTISQEIDAYVTKVKKQALTFLNQFTNVWLDQATSSAQATKAAERGSELVLSPRSTSGEVLSGAAVRRISQSGQQYKNDPTTVKFTFFGKKNALGREVKIDFIQIKTPSNGGVIVQGNDDERLGERL